LQPPCESLRDAYFAMVEEFRAAGEGEDWPHGATEQKGVRATEDFDAYVQAAHDYAVGRNVPEGWVPCSAFWLIAGEDLVGTASLRHQLNDLLRVEGGHLGYCIRPSRRREGLMTKFCSLLLDEARRLGLARLLITCTEHNLGSAGVIEANGGKLQDLHRSEILHPGENLRRYWIDLPPA
jgi:predicted acetyltransferase